MTSWIVELTGGRGEITVDCDDVTTREGSLWLLSESRPAGSPRSTALSRCTPVLILAARTWTACYPAGSDPLSAPASSQSAPAAAPQILAQADIPDPLRRR